MKFMLQNERRNYFMRKHADAVSPVVGVMLMLVITIVIATVVSAFPRSLASPNNEKELYFCVFCA